ncbi:MAG: chemotaxis protein CheA [Myxococcales bacterium]|nr:chemotaxis protein CheA [Myxococcales bacterium]
MDDDIVKEFLVESHENLDQLDRDFVALEADPTARGQIAGIFRTIHTIKGTSGFLGFSGLESLTHVAENLLSQLREGTRQLDADIVTALLQTVDAVREMLASIEATGTDGQRDDSELIARLARLQGKGDDRAAHKQASHRPAPPLAPTPAPPAAPAAPIPTMSKAPEHAPPPEVTATAVSDTSVRVDVGLLDRLMNLVGELVLARNQILQFGSTVKDGAFHGTSQRLNLLTTELQEGVMKTRMQPIGNVWGKFPRVVRDLAVTCGKQVRIEMEGEDTELDRTIIEAIKDPLTHAVRNSIDHGIERPEVRVAAGKPAQGRLFLRAFHEGGQVNIEISDDGGGIDPIKVRDRAVARGLVPADRAQRMSDRELVSLVFLPGFSTAEKVTNVSGRGVGMDVVKTNIERIGGTVELTSRHGSGTSLRVKIPLTLAIIPALVVTTRSERYAIPQVNLLELVRIEPEAAARAVESIHGVPVFRLRGNLLPLVYLGAALELGGPSTAPDGSLCIVVLSADDRTFGLVVDGVHDTEEIVVKPLGKELKGLTAFAGATIMGDGKVALILDVLGIAQRANVVSSSKDRKREGADTDLATGTEDKQALLLVRVGADMRMAIPLAMVARLEELPRRGVERAGRHQVVQYREQLLPLVDVATVVGASAADQGDADAPLQVVVHARNGRRVGLVVEQIVDIVEDFVRIERPFAQRGIVGATVVEGRVTNLLDVEGVIDACDPSLSAA